MFVRTFVDVKARGQWSRLPEAMQESCSKPESAEGFVLAKLVAEGDRELEATIEAELAAQRERLAKAETVLAGPKPTKKAADDQRGRRAQGGRRAAPRAGAR